MSVRLASMEKISFLLDESISKCTAVSICILLQFHGPVASKLVTFNPSLRQIICKVFALKISCTLRYSFDNTEQYFNNQLKYMCYELLLKNVSEGEYLLRAYDLEEASLSGCPKSADVCC